jgi:hypothetical protein
MCVVATAAHGDYSAPEVVVLRLWRDQFLLKNPAGRAFVRYYYANGPVLADWIAQREWARSTTRIMLALPVLIARGMLDLPELTRALFAILMSLLAFRSLRRAN